MPYLQNARKIANAFMDKALDYEANELSLLAKKWGIVSNNLEDLITQLAQKQILTKDQLFRLDLYQQFLQESNYQVAKFNALASNVIKDGQAFNAKLGLDMTKEAIRLVTTKFNAINFDAVNYLIGKTSVGSPLYDLLAKSYPESVSKITDTLLNATALGWNPEKTAKIISQYMDGNLSRAMTIARTEQIQVLRETSLEQMKQSGVVKGWIRIEQPDACDECQDENGKHFDFNQDFDTHPNCRGASIPDMG